MCFFFFKQKRAYGVDVCDWSSEVCAADLRERQRERERHRERQGDIGRDIGREPWGET